MPKHHTICDGVKRRWALIRWSTRIYLTRISRGEFTKSQVRFLKGKNKINSKYDIFLHLMMKNK